MAQVALPKKRPAAKNTKGVAIHASFSAPARLALGREIQTYLETTAIANPNVWKMVVRDVMHLAYSDAARKRARRAYVEWCRRTQMGLFTECGAGVTSRRQHRIGEQHRSPTISQVIGYELLQWFVDEVLELKSRSDSGLCITEARRLCGMLKQTYIDAGTLPPPMPAISKQWFLKWRRRHGISIRHGTTLFKVSYDKVLRRVAVMLSNIFRLRALWDKCHPGRPMHAWIRNPHG